MVNNTSDVSNNLAAAGDEYNEGNIDENQENMTSRDTFIPYETLSELYSNVDYDTDASENEYYCLPFICFYNVDPIYTNFLIFINKIQLACAGCLTVSKKKKKK